MTPSEAVSQAMQQHEFRYIVPVPLNGYRLRGVVAVCWCGAETPPFLTEKSARDAHGRHRDRAALMRSFGQWEQ